MKLVNLYAGKSTITFICNLDIFPLISRRDICSINELALDTENDWSVWHQTHYDVISGLTTHSKNKTTWLKGEVRENLGDFRKSIQILTFLSPLPHVPLPFTKTNYDLKKDAINKFGIKYWTSNPVWVKFQEHGSSFYVNIEEKVWLLVKKIRTWKDWQGD